VKVGRRLAGAIAGSELVVLDTGHVPHTTEPAAFAAHLIPLARALAAFARRRRAPAGPPV